MKRQGEEQILYDNAPLLKTISSIRPYVTSYIEDELGKIMLPATREILAILVTDVFLSKHVLHERLRIYNFCKKFCGFVRDICESTASPKVNPLHPSTPMGHALSDSSSLVRGIVATAVSMSPLGLLGNWYYSDTSRVDEMLKPHVLLARFMFNNIDEVKNIFVAEIALEIDKAQNKNERDIIYIGAITEQWHDRIQELVVLIRLFPQLSSKSARHFFSENVLGVEKWTSEFLVIIRVFQYLPTTMRECSILEGLALYLKVCHSPVWNKLLQPVSSTVIPHHVPELREYLHKKEYKKLFNKFFNLLNIGFEVEYETANNVLPLVHATSITSSASASASRSSAIYNSQSLSSFVGSVCEGAFDGMVEDQGRRVFNVHGAVGLSLLTPSAIIEATRETTPGKSFNLKVDTTSKKENFLQAMGFSESNTHIFSHIQAILEASHSDLNKFFQDFADVFNVVLVVATVKLTKQESISGSAKLFKPRQINEDTLKVAVAVDRENNFYTTEVDQESASTTFRHSVPSAIFGEIVEKLGRRIDPDFEYNAKLDGWLMVEELRAREELVVSASATVSAVATSSAEVFDISSQPSCSTSGLTYEEVVIASVLNRKDLLATVDAHYLKSMDTKILNPVEVARLLGGEILSRCGQDKRQRGLDKFVAQLVSDLQRDEAKTNSLEATLESSAQSIAQRYLTKEGESALKAITILAETSFTSFSDGVSKGVLIPFQDLNKPVFTKGTLTVAGLIAMGEDTPALQHIAKVESWFSMNYPLNIQEVFRCFGLAVKYNSQALIKLLTPRLKNVVIPKQWLLEYIRFAVKHKNEDLIMWLALQPGAGASTELESYLSGSTASDLLETIKREMLNGGTKIDSGILAIVSKSFGSQSCSSLGSIVNAYVLNKVGEVSEAIATELETPSSVRSKLALGDTYTIKALQQNFIRAYPDSVLIILDTKQKCFSVTSKSSSSGLQVKVDLALFPYPKSEIPEDSAHEVVIAIDEFNRVYTVDRRTDLPQGIYFNTDQEAEILGGRNEAEIARCQLRKKELLTQGIPHAASQQHTLSVGGSSHAGPSRAYILGSSCGTGYEGFLNAIREDTGAHLSLPKVHVQQAFQAFVNKYDGYFLKVLYMGSQYSEKVYYSENDGEGEDITVEIIMDDADNFYTISDHPQGVPAGFYTKDAESGVVTKFKVYEGILEDRNSKLLGLSAENVERACSIFKLPLVSTLPPQKPGFRLEIIDSAEIQGDTKSCADNALIVARKASSKGYEVFLYERHVSGNIYHLTVLSYRPDAISQEEWLKEIEVAAITYDSVCDQEYRDAMGVPKTLYLPGRIKTKLDHIIDREERLMEAIELEANVEKQTSVQSFSLELLFSWLQMVQNDKLNLPLHYHYPVPPYKGPPDDDWGNNGGDSRSDSSESQGFLIGNNTKPAFNTSDTDFLSYLS